MQVKQGVFKLTKTAKTYTFFIIYLLLNLTVSLLLSDTGNIYFEDPMVYNIVAQLALFVPIVLIGVKMSGGGFKGALSLNKIGITDVVVAALLTFATGPIVSLFSIIGIMFYPNNVSAALSVAYDSPLILSIIAICIIPAVFEELIFRGIVFSGFANQSLARACLMGGLIFAIAHFDAQQSLYAFAIGVLLCYIVYRTKSVIPGMITHFMINFTNLMASRVQLSQAETELVNNTAVSELLAPYFMLSLAALPILVYLVSMMGRKYGRGKPLFRNATPFPAIKDDFKIEDESVFDYAPQLKFQEKLLKWQLILIIAVYVPVFIV